MKQAIAGVTPSTIREAPVMTVWPSIVMFSLARQLGQLYANRTGIYVLTIGNLLCLACIPVSLALYFLRIGPVLGRRYTITNRRVVVKDGLGAKDLKSIEFDRFDAIDIVVRPGQEWYDAGDLVFRQGKIETFRLDAVSRPRAFRATCIECRNAHVGVAQSLAAQRR
ncbi:MAG: PH domain-containing protein [Planctomycetes bacterium]|nr:PH domain-containing protein [Planctomycetota bacterium]